MTTLHQPLGQEKKNVRKRIGTRIVACAIAAALLAGCGGGGGGSTPPVSAKPGSTTQTVKMTVRVPGKNGTNVRGKHVPLYISRSTLGMGIDWVTHSTGFGTNKTPNANPQYGVALDPNTFPDVGNGMGCQSPGPDGSYSCNFYIPSVPVGYLDFKVTMWDADPSGCSFTTYGSKCAFSAPDNALSTNLVTNQVILQNQYNDPSVNFTLLPVVDSVALSSNPATMVDGTAAGGTLTVTAKDADGNVIIGSDKFVDKNGNDLTITVSSASSHVKFGGNPTVSFTTPNGSNFMSAAYSYDGQDMTAASLDNLFSVTSPTSALVNGSIANFDLLFTKSSTGVTVPGAPQLGLSVTTPAAPAAIVAGPAGDAHVYTIENGKIAAIKTGTATIDKEFAVTGTPAHIALGADNDIWYVDSAANKVGKFNPLTADATLGPFAETVTPGFTLANLASAPDGQIWVVDTSANIYSLSPQTMAYSARYQFLSGGGGVITSGKAYNGGLDSTVCWANSTGTFPLACFDTTAPATPGGYQNDASAATSMVIGPDKLLYVGHKGSIEAWQVVGSGSGGVVLAYTYNLAGSSATVNGMTVGHDGAVWFTETGATNLIGRLQPGSGAQGTLNEYDSHTGLSASATPYGITLGADNNLWLTDNSSNKTVDQVVP